MIPASGSAHTPTHTRRWESSPPGSSAGIWCSNILRPAPMSPSAGPGYYNALLARVRPACAGRPVKGADRRRCRARHNLDRLDGQSSGGRPRRRRIGAPRHRHSVVRPVQCRHGRIKLAIVVMVIGFGLPLVTQANLTPFIPPNDGTFGHYGWSGVFRATGGDLLRLYRLRRGVGGGAGSPAIPARHLRSGILDSALLCTVLYILMSLTMTGLAPYKAFNVAPRVPTRSRMPDRSWLVTSGRCGRGRRPRVGRSGSVATANHGLSMPWPETVWCPACSGTSTALPHALARNDRYRHCRRPRGRLLKLGIFGEFVSIGTLAGVRHRVHRHPGAARNQTECQAAVPHALGTGRGALGVVMCGGMMDWLPGDTWVRLLVWTIIGLIIYVLYGIRHAKPPRWAVETVGGSDRVRRRPQGPRQSIRHELERYQLRRRASDRST